MFGWRVGDRVRVIGSEVEVGWGAHTWEGREVRGGKGVEGGKAMTRCDVKRP